MAMQGPIRPSFPFLLVFSFLLSTAAQSEGQALGHWQGWCELGGHQHAQADFVQASYPSCAVDVYFSGTSTHAPIFSDLKSTPLPNPFTAGSDASIQFYAQQGIQYDVVTSGAGMPISFTYPNVTTGGFGGSGGILSSPSSPQTITGQMLTLTASAPLMVQGATLLTETSTKSLNKVEYADRFAGTDACAKIHAAILALPKTGGIVDARGFHGAQSCSSDPFAGGATPAVELLIGPAKFQLSVGWFPSAGSRITCLDPALSTIAGSAGFSLLTLRSDTTVENCHLLSGNNGITSLSKLAAARVMVRNNIVEGSVLGPNVNLGGGTTYWVVQGNVIRNGLNEGVLINANGNAVADDPNCTSADNCGYNQILDNWIYGNQKNGIDVASSRNTIRGNHVFRNGGSGHTDTGRDQFGILLFAAVGETPTSQNIVSDNEIFSNNTFGISLTAAPGGTISYNIVTNNSVRYNGTSASAGPADGIFLIGFQSGNVLNNLISNNVVVGNTRNGIYLNFPIPGPGLMSQNQIIGNQLLFNASYGFLTDGGCCGGGVFDNYVVNNVASGNVVGQIGDLGSTRAIYSNKTADGTLLDVATGVFGSAIPTSMFAVSMTGIANNTAGFKHARFESNCTVAPLATCKATYNWATAFADTNYTVACNLAGAVIGVPVLGAISSKTPSGFTITIANAGTGASSASEVDCIAVHD
jgi:parallel beta-helix repeat protein